MPAGDKHFLPQTIIGLVTGTIAAIVLVGAWAALPLHVSKHDGIVDLLMITVLVGTAVLTFRFPIHIRLKTKIHMNSVPTFLMVALLPPPLAAAAAGLAMLTGETTVRSARGTYPSEIATQTGRWIIISLGASLVAHYSGGGAAQLVVAAMIMWTGDVVTLPLLLTPLTGERPARVISTIAREGGLAEGAQYLVGLLGALAARPQQMWAVILLLLPTALVYLAFKSSKEVREGTTEMLENMADTVDLRDPYSGGHSRRVAELCAGILAELGRSGPEVDRILSAARVHDIGKIGVPDHVLHKMGSLTDEEWALIKLHSERGADLLMRYPDFSRGVEMVRHHHERWDGTGYPHRLKEGDIPFGARVIAVADAFDALTSERPHRRGLSPDKAATVLREGRGQQWDALIVDALLRSIADRLDRPGAIHLRVVPPIEEERGPSALA